MASPYALDFSPVANALSEAKQYGLAQNKLAMEQERLGFERDLQPFKLQQAKQTTESGDLELAKTKAGRVANFADTYVNAPGITADEKAARWQKVLSLPDLQDDHHINHPVYGPLWRDPNIGPGLLKNTAQGFRDPGAEAAQAATTYHQLGAGAEAFAGARAKDPAILAARMDLVNKIMDGTATQADYAAYAKAGASNAPPMPGIPSVPGAAPPQAQRAASVAQPSATTSGATPGMQGSPVYAPTPDAVAKLPADTWYTTPDNLTPRPKTAAGVDAATGMPVNPPHAQLAAGLPGSQPQAPPVSPVIQDKSTPPGQQRPFAQPPLVPQGGDPTSRANVPYAPEASRTVRPYQTDEDKRLLMLHMLDPTMRQAIENTPGHKGAVKAAELRATNQVQSEEKQAQGSEMIRQIDELRDRMVNAGPDVVNYATGPYLSDPVWQKRLALLPLGNGKGSALEEAQILNTKVQHTIDALATQMGALQGGSKGATDQSRDELKSAVGKAFESRGAAGVFEVLHDAKRNIQGLSKLPIDAPLKDYMPPEWAAAKPGQPAAGQPPQPAASVDKIKAAGAPVWDAVDKVYRERGPDGQWHPVASAEPAPTKQAGPALAPKDRAAERRAQATAQRNNPAPDLTPQMFDADLEGAAFQNGLAPLDIARKYDALRGRLRPDQLRALHNLELQAERSGR